MLHSNQIGTFWQVEIPGVRSWFRSQVFGLRSQVSGKSKTRDLTSRDLKPKT